jgi:hypothetical protein
VVPSRIVAKLMVMASGVVKAPRGGPRAVSAYVVLSAGPQSRVFRVRGLADAPKVEELEPATTLDIKRFQNELQEDLQPQLDELRAEGHPAHIEPATPDWVIAFVRKHLKDAEGLD